MTRRFVLALALVSALTGCVAPPPKGAFVEYRAGLTPITRPVKCPGTYALHDRDRPAEGPLLTRQAHEGERLGFCRDPNGDIVATAPEHTLLLQPGDYTWEIVPGSVEPWRHRFRAKVAERAASATVTACGIVGVTVLVALIIGAKFLYAYAEGQSR
jgi:hypothetical protein